MSDVLTELSIELEKELKTDLDFFRLIPHVRTTNLEKQNKVKKVFRRKVMEFYRAFKHGEVQNFPALDALKRY